ncbi:MAG: hypothetical protein AAF560_08835 [Acidobacteriota bacterium]
MLRSAIDSDRESFGLIADAMDADRRSIGAVTVSLEIVLLECRGVSMMKTQAKVQRFAFSGGVMAWAVLQMSAGVCEAYTITTFNPDDFIPAEMLPTPMQTAALDMAAGIEGLTVEDFENTTVIPELTIEFGGQPPTATLSPDDLIAEPWGIWDGSLELGTNLVLNPFEPLIFRPTVDLDVFAIGISGFQSANELSINGINQGALNDLPNFVPAIGLNSRNLYIRIDREAGDPPITEIAFLPDPLGPNPVGDFVRVDHVAIAETPETPIASIPTLSASGLVTMTVAMVAMGTFLLRRQRLLQ